MKWLSDEVVECLCAALFIAATHASQLQGMMDRAAEEKLLRILLANLLKMKTNFVNLGKGSSN